MMREWRKQLARAGVTLTPERDAAYTREETLFLEAVKVFGNDEDAGMWYLRQTPTLPPFENPAKVATDSPEGLRRTLELLASIAPAVVPQPSQYPVIKRGRSS